MSLVRAGKVHSKNGFRRRQRFFYDGGRTPKGLGLKGCGNSGLVVAEEEGI